MPVPGDKKKGGDSGHGPQTLVDIGQLVSKTEFFCWRTPARLGEATRRFLLTPEFRVGLQTACGQIALGLLVFARPLYFTLACFTPIFYYVSGLFRPTPHIGCCLKSSALITSALLANATLGGVVLTLAHLPGVAHTTFVCIFAGIGLLIPAIIRGSGMFTEGIMGSIMYIVTVIVGQFVPLQQLWTEVITHLYLVTAANGLFFSVSGVVVLPTLATTELYATLADTTQALGQSISGYAACIFVEDRFRGVLSGTGKPLTSADTDKQHREDPAHGLTRHSQSLADDALAVSYSQFLEDVTDPFGRHAQIPLPTIGGVTPVSAHRPLLLHARLLLAQAQAEPQWLSSRPLQVQQWIAVVEALSTLLTRSAALGSILQGGESLVHEGKLGHFLHDDTIPLLRLVYAQLAASTAALSAGIRGGNCHGAGSLKVMLSPSWAVLEFHLAAAINASLKSFWASQHLKLNDLRLLHPMPQIRVVLYIAALTYGIMEGMAGLEKAVVAAVGCKEQLDTFADHEMQESILRDNLISVLQKETHFQPIADEPMEGTGLGREVPGLIPAYGVPRISQEFSRFISEFRKPSHQRTEVSHAAPQSPPSQSTPVSHPAPAIGSGSSPPKPAQPKHWRLPSWVRELAEALLGIPSALTLRDALWSAVDSLTKPSRALAELRYNRRLHYFLRFYISCGAALLLTLALSANYPRVQSWGLLYGCLTMAVVVFEKVDVSLQRGFLRIVGTVIGGTLGYVFMLHMNLASNPYALSVLLAAIAFIGGALLNKKFKYAVVLAMITLNSLVLCQYNPAGGVGSVQMYIVRVIVICAAVAVVLIVELIFPWYMSTAALETLGTIFRDSTTILSHYYECYIEELQLAADTEQTATIIAGLQRLERRALLDKISKPLATLEVALEREAVMWRHGVLALPGIIRHMVASMQGVLDCLAAAELVLMQRPRISGRYSGAPYHNVGSPMHEHFLVVMARVVELGQAAYDLLHGRTAADHLERITLTIDNLHKSRVKLRQKYVLAMHIYQGRVKRGDAPFAKERTADDQIRLESCIFAFLATIDKVVLLARTLVADEWLQGYSSANFSRHARLWLSAQWT